MLLWELDLQTGEFEVMIPVESLNSWTNVVEDLAGITFDPVKRTLFVLSEDSKLVIESHLNGTIIGEPLSVSQANQPEGIYVAAPLGELWIASEPNELLVYKANEETCASSSAVGSSYSHSMAMDFSCAGSMLLTLLLFFRSVR